jgi:hypothetical protein
MIAELNFKRGGPKLPQFTVLLPTIQEIYQEHELVTGRTDKICTGWGRGDDFRSDSIHQTSATAP